MTGRPEESTGASRGASIARIRSCLQGLAASEVKVARWVLKNPEKVPYLSMARVAEACDVSDATVLRFCRSTGFRSYTDLKISLVRDLATHTQIIHDDISTGDDPVAVAHKVFISNIQALHDTLAVLDTDALNQSVRLIGEARRVLIVGVGTSGPIVQDMYYRLFRLGIACSAQTDSYLQLMEVALLGPEDVVVAISQSGSSADPVLTLEEARRHGVPTICITGNAQSPLTKLADVTLLSVSDETRAEALASRIAQMTIVHALYVSLCLKDVEKAVRNEELIWEAIIPKSL